MPNRHHSSLVKLIRLITAIGLLISVLLCLGPGAPAAAQRVPDPRFGVVEAYAAPDAAGELGAGWTRVTFEWNRIQPDTPEEWNVVPLSDSDLAGEIARGREVVGLLVTTPGWATDKERGPGVPRGLYLPPDHPENLWATYVRAIVERYAGRIDHWTIWNEPDISPESPDVTWGGSTEDFVQLVKVAYLVIKETNPNATVHLPGLTHWHNDHWLGQFLDVLLADPEAVAHDAYFDVATLHLYHEPEKIHDIIARTYDEMHSRGIYKPIWVAETNAYLSRVSEAQQADFIIQGFSLEIAAGAQRLGVYKMADTATDPLADPEPFGLVRMDGSRRPAFTAYQIATTYLSGFRGGTWDRRDNVSVVTIDRGARTTTAAWSRTVAPQTAMIAARTTRALLVDARGKAEQVHPERGYYFITLPGAECTMGTAGCALGGPPVLLVEDAPPDANTAPPPASPTPSIGGDGLEATPTPLPTPAIAPTAPPSPTPTLAPTHTPTPSPTPLPTVTPTPEPLKTSDVPPGRPWILMGVLALAMGGTAVAVGHTESVERRQG